MVFVDDEDDEPVGGSGIIRELEIKMTVLFFGTISGYYRVAVVDLTVRRGGTCVRRGSSSSSSVIKLKVVFGIVDDDCVVLVVVVVVVVVGRR